MDFQGGDRMSSSGEGRVIFGDQCLKEGDRMSSSGEERAIFGDQCLEQGDRMSSSGEGRTIFGDQCLEELADTVHALCNVQNLLTNGLLCLGELAEEPNEAFTFE